MLVLRAVCGVIYRFQQWVELIAMKRRSKLYQEQGPPPRQAANRRRKSPDFEAETPVSDKMSPTILLDRTSVVYEHPVRFPGAGEQREDTPPKLRSSSKIKSVVPHQAPEVPKLAMPNADPQSSGQGKAESHYNSDDDDEFEFYS